MLLRAWIAGLLLAAATVGPSAAQEPDSVEAVEPGGPGELTKCRNWLVASSCKTYHHISLPPRITVGDTITVTFGSSRKEYEFPVARIAHKGRHCAIFSEAEGDRHQIDKINVAPCYRASTVR
ncbi:MAG: hypothetical protein E6G83_03195 [Alphaproteobacteria bacterium]|nr:MAG: hypothetical protein E6G83_03195 [Alphaproteobacteria bacterium]